MQRPNIDSKCWAAFLKMGARLELYSFRTRGLTSCATEPLMANPTNL